MANEQLRAAGLEMIRLLPEEIVIDTELARPEAGIDEAAETEKIKTLAQTIKREGQLQPVLVREIDNGGVIEYHAVAGHRRTRAIGYLNLMRTKHEEPLHVNCTVARGVDATEAYRKSLIENIHRENLNPIQLAIVISRVKLQNGWKGSKEVADFLQVSRATITQHEKLKDLPEDIQQKVADGTLSAQSAHDLLDVREDKRQEVVAKAASKAKQEAASRPSHVGKGQLEPGDGSGVVATTVAGKPQADDEPEKGKIKRKYVIAAARETEDALEKPKPRSRREIVEVFDQLDGPAYGYMNGPVRVFIRYFVDKWCAGEGSDRTLLKKFDDMLTKDRGTEGKADKAETAEEEAAVAPPKKVIKKGKKAA